MTKNFKIYAILSIMLIGIAFAGIGCLERPDDDRSITVRGSDTVLPLSQAEAEAYMDKYPDDRISVGGGGSGVGIAAMIDGEINIAMASREMRQSEIDSANRNNIYPIEHTIAWDGIAVVVHPENPVKELTFDQLRGIYNGSISNWEEVGGEDRRISAITRDSSSGTYAFFREVVLKNDEYRPDALAMSATGGIVQEVSQNRGAIGYVGYAYLDQRTHALSLDEGNGYVPPTAESIQSGDYSLARPLYYYTKGEPEGLTKDFLDFVLGPEGQDIVTEVGYFPAR
ncbi:phosphate binding protein [Methanosalsum zhilinae DSM 4017]|uniref:Phosphate binding protein n=1 Tax=Methanosalsum zhilinae (strain DSM 4017 / NBRC 107636 / OCM 62 / WeN5) TaxID=679901 RepID=F7XNU5_METZD|nr:phosphate ABC transporter substrate-binding protein [Methanosalsum zhilinae]AEH61302.1 phosphate binding protein [Methanosalsum zhilinae DSM 4017]